MTPEAGLTLQPSTAWDTSATPPPSRWVLPAPVLQSIIPSHGHGVLLTFLAHVKRPYRSGQPAELGRAASRHLRELAVSCVSCHYLLKPPGPLKSI